MLLTTPRGCVPSTDEETVIRLALIAAIVSRVSFLIGNLNEEHGGAQRLLHDLCSHLPNDEFETTVYYMFGEGTYRADFEAVGTEVVALCADSNHDLGAFARFVRHLRMTPPDVLQTNSPISGAWGRIAGKLFDETRVLSVEHHVHDTRSPFTRAIDDATLPLADVVVGVSEAVESSFAPWERPLLNRIETVPNGVDVRAIEEESREAGAVLEPYPVEPTDRIVGTVGRLIAEKGHRYLIDAMVAVRRNDPNTKLVLVGDGPEKVKLERRAHNRGLMGGDGDDAVVFAGSQSSVPPFLTEFDVGVFPSLNESFGLALAEAMAAGVPVVGSDIPPFRRLLDDGEAGVLVPPRDSSALARAIATMLTHDGRREQLRARGRKRIERQFSVEKTVHEYADLYRETVDR